MTDPQRSETEPTLACMGECFGPQNGNGTWAEMVAALRSDNELMREALRRIVESVGMIPTAETMSLASIAHDALRSNRGDL